MIVETSSHTERSIAGTLNKQWRAQQMSIVERLKMNKSPELPVPAPAPPAPLSERAARHAHDVELLELQNAGLHQALNDMEVRAKTAEGLLDKERKENTYLLNNRDTLMRDNAQLATLLANMSDLIDRARAIKSLPAPMNEAEVKAQLEQALAPVEQE